MKGFINVFKREFNIIRHKPFILFITLVYPLFFTLIIIWTFISGTAINLPTAVLDENNSDVSRALIRTVNSTRTVNIKYKLSNTKEGYDLIRNGKIYALLVIPRDFKSDLNMSKQPKIVCYYNNQMILTGGLISKDIQAAISGLAKSNINLISIDERVKSNPYLNYSYFLTYAGIAHVFQVFAVLLSVWSIGIEFRQGSTKEWPHTADNSIVSAVFGKLSLYFLILTILITCSYIFYVVFCTAPFEGSIFYTFIGACAFIFAYQMMGLLFIALLANLRFAFSLGSVYVSLGFTFAGMTYPAFAMPLAARIYSSFLPVRPFVNLIVNQALRDIPVIYDIKYLVWILTISLLGVSSLPLLKKKVLNEELWYQI